MDSVKGFGLLLDQCKWIKVKTVAMQITRLTFMHASYSFDKGSRTPRENSHCQVYTTVVTICILLIIIQCHVFLHA